MMLMSADGKEVLAMMTGKKREAPVAQAAERPIRNRQVGFSINSWCSRIREALRG